jgi:hypothetical protein
MGAKSLALTLLLAVGCSGPRPEVTRVTVADAAPTGYVRVELDVVNRSGGHGQATIDITLVSRGTGATILSERTLELTAHQQVHLTVDVAAPRGDYDVHATAIYPD